MIWRRSDGGGRDSLRPSPMKRTVFAIAIIAAIHLALTWYSSAETFAHGLERGIDAQFGMVVPPDTWFDNFVKVTTAILLLPVGIVFRWLPLTTGNHTADGILFWTILVLNSILWGTAIYWSARKIRTLLQRPTVSGRDF